MADTGNAMLAGAPDEAGNAMSAPVNLQAAHVAMGLTPQEIALYQRHLGNLYGAGGVDNQDGSRSSLYATTVEVDGRHYVVPTVRGGQIMNPRDAINAAADEGFNRFPSYGSQQEAASRYDKLHSFMERDTADYFRSTRARKPQ